MPSAPILPGKFHNDVTSDLQSGGIAAAGWRIETKGINASSKRACVINPSVLSKGDLKIEFESMLPEFPKGLTVGGTYSTKRGLQPSATLTSKSDGGTHKSKLFLRSGVIQHDWKHGKGAFSGMLKTSLCDWGATTGSFACRLSKDFLGGVAFDYDPLRSGLKSYSFTAKYLNNYAVSIDAFNTIRVTGKHFVPVGETGFTSYFNIATGHSEKSSGVVLGGSFRPSSSDIDITAEVNLANGKVSLGLRLFKDTAWRCVVGAHINAYKASWDGLGISFLRE